MVRIVALAILLATLGVASAHAAGIAPLRKCTTYVPGDNKSVPIGGLGWTPNSQVRLAYAGNDYAGTATTNAQGAFLLAAYVPLRFPRSSRHVRVYGLYAKDYANPALIAKRRVQLVRLGVTVPGRARPSSRVNYRFFGFPRGRRIWAHYSFGGKFRRTTYMGRASKLCGTKKHRQTYLPTRVHYGLWRVYLSNSKRASRKHFVVRGSFTVYRRYFRKATAASAFGMHLTYGSARND